jgi:hypothetical protein
MMRGTRHKVGILGTLIAALTLALGVPSGAQASKGEWSIFEDHTALVQSGIAKRIDTLDKIKLLGADTLRIEFHWNEIVWSPKSKTRPRFAASNPAAYMGAPNAFPGFGQYDDLVLRAHAMGFRILGTITGDAPRWATAGGKSASFATANYKVNSAEYAGFAEAVARRYAGNFAGLPAIRYWSIWNEPNHKQFLKPLSAGPAIYRRLVDSGVPAIRRGAVRGAKVFVGETAPSGVAGKSTGPRAFLQRWLCLNKRWKKVRSGSCRHFKKVKVDGYAHHPYGPPGKVSSKRDTISIGVIKRLGDYLNKAAARGRFSRRLPIYDTEFGYQSNPPDRSVSTSPSRQAQLINEKEEVHYRYARMKSYSQYLLYDDKPLFAFQTALRFRSGKQKPAYRAYRLPLVVHSRGRRGVYIWGRVRPGSGTRYVQLYQGGRKSGPRIHTNSRGYFGVKRKGKGKYRFKAYERSGSKLELIGTSRTARPI